MGGSFARIRFVFSIAVICMLMFGLTVVYRNREQLKCPVVKACPGCPPPPPTEGTVVKEKVVEKRVEVKIQPKFVNTWSAVDPDHRIHGPKANATWNHGRAKKNPKPVVPRIVHFVWPKSKTRTKFRFHQLIAMLAAYKHVKPNKIWFWHEGQIPTGDYWKEMRRKVPILELKYRRFPRSIFGNPLNVEEHVSDIVRLESVMNYGGIYLDLDVVAVRSFDPLLYYNTTMGYEVPGGLCNAVIISRPNATFLTKWYQRYRTFNDSNWAGHSVFLPAGMAHEFPSLIHTETDSLHSPGWIRFPRMYYNNSWDWSDNYAMHMYYRLYNKDHNPTDIRTLNTTLGRLFRFIYYV